MIKTVNCSVEMRQALNENLAALLDGSRPTKVVKEVNNTLGKILSDVKMELLHKSMIEDKSPINWFELNSH